MRSGPGSRRTPAAARSSRSRPRNGTSPPPSFFPHRHAGTDPLAEGGNHLLGAFQLDPAVTPGADAGLRSSLVEPFRSVLDEDDPPPALEKAADRGVVAD